MDEPAENSLGSVKLAGLILGPLLALLTYYLVPALSLDEAGHSLGLAHPGRATAALAVLMALWWMTEAIAIEATALLPLILLPLLGVYSSRISVADSVSVEVSGKKFPAKVVELTTKPAKTEEAFAPEEKMAKVEFSTPLNKERANVALKQLTKPNPVQRAASPYADRSVFLYLGGFLLALGVERWNLHKRIALLTLLTIGTRPSHLVGGVMLITAGISLWISNTATAVMMLPIGLSLVALLQKSWQDHSAPIAATDPQNFAISMMLGIAYAASIGGLGTLIGTPPNVFFRGFMEDRGISIPFERWMLFAVPLVAVYLWLAWLLLVKFLFPLRATEIPGGHTLVRQELAQLGPLSRAEAWVGAIFFLTALAWIFREAITKSSWGQANLPWLSSIDDSTIALIGGVSLFIIPLNLREGQFLLDWKSCERLPWGVLLLFGGGLSLAAAMEESKLAEWIAQQVSGLQGLPIWVLIVLVVVGVILFSELASNLATATALLPILYEVAVGLKLDPLVLCVPAIVAASCGFMLPVATPPNAIVFGSGHIPLRKMLVAGFWLDLIGVILIPIFVFTLGRWTLGIRF